MYIFLSLSLSLSQLYSSCMGFVIHYVIRCYQIRSGFTNRIRGSFAVWSQFASKDILGKILERRKQTTSCDCVSGEFYEFSRQKEALGLNRCPDKIARRWGSYEQVSTCLRRAFGFGEEAW